MNKTLNYNLKLPEKSEQYNIEYFNENNEVIDEQLKMNNDSIQKEISDRKSANDTLRESIDDKLDKTLNGVKGILPVANGGTGQTSQATAFTHLAQGIPIWEDVRPSDNDRMFVEYNGSFSRRPTTMVWEYFKKKISSVLGLTATSYGGKASTAGTADTAKACSGNAATATKLATARNIQITDGTNKGTAKSFDGSGSIELPLPATPQFNRVTIPSTKDVSLSSYDNDPFVIGTKTGMNMGIDQNEIQVRNNGEADVLYLNDSGGDVVLGNNNSLISIPGRLKSQTTYSYQKNYQYCRIELDFYNFNQIGFIKFSIWDGGCTDVAIFFNFVDRKCEYYVDGKQQNITNIRYLFDFEDESSYDKNHVTIYIALVRKNYGNTFITYPSTALKWFTAEFADTTYAPNKSTVANQLV